MTYDIRIPEQVLESAARLSLKDLLESPPFQAHLVSALSNSLQNFHKVMDITDERDEFLMFRLEQIYKSIPHDARRVCFDEIGRIARERREERQKYVR